ncbi:MAG: hypothetical protein H7336_13655 [Bacteriovorax sp.]|nr:hypothetical protein [Bacteriovorax sp.]
MSSKKIYIFVPGYYGTTLVDPKSGREIWGDAREIFLGRKTLAMPIPGMKIKGALDLKPHKLIPDKKILGGLLKEDAYDKTIALLKSTDAEDVIPVAWDWRADPIRGVKLIDEAVKKAKQKYPGHDFVLVSHSFGSLICSYYLRYGVQDYFEAKENWSGLAHFAKVLISAAPFKGSMSLFRNMFHGIKFGFNPNMQTPLAFCTFESSYYLLPPHGEDFVLDEKENKISLNLYDSETWMKNSFGLFHDKLKFSKETFEARKNYISLHLSRGKKFNELVHSEPVELPVDKKKILYLSGFGFKTTNSGVWIKNTKRPNVILYFPKEFKKWKSAVNTDIIYSDGDSTIARHSMKLPQFLKSLNTKNIHENYSHLDILQSSYAQTQIHDFLLH